MVDTFFNDTKREYGLWPCDVTYHQQYILKEDNNHIDSLISLTTGLPAVAAEA